MKVRLLMLLLAAVGIVVVGAVSVGLWWYRLAKHPTFEQLGGTVLIYEVDTDKLPGGQLPADYQPQEMADVLKRRIDPTDLLGIEVESVDALRVAVRIPVAGKNSEEVQRVKDLVSQVGMLEFRILANERDDQEAIAAARRYFESIHDPRDAVARRNERRTAEDERAARGLPPRGPGETDGKSVFRWSNQWGSGEARYSWMALSLREIWKLNLDMMSKPDGQPNPRFQEVTEAREQCRPLILPDLGQTVLFGRRCQDPRRNPGQQLAQLCEYFLLTREPNPGERLTGTHLTHVAAVLNDQRPAVRIRLSPVGGELLRALTQQNQSSGNAERGFTRMLAICLDDTVEVSVPIRGVMGAEVQVTVDSDKTDAEMVVRILRAGGLPAALRPVPNSETFVAPTE